MKKLLLLFAVAAIMFSCSGGGPRSVAESFMTDFSKGKVEQAAQYCTDEAGGFLKTMAQMAPDQVENKDFKFNFVREEIDGDTAKVFFTDEAGEEDSIDLVKVDGKWKVTIVK